MEEKRETSRDRTRREQFELQKGACCLCGGLMTLDRKDKRYFATFEHTVPRSRGGAGVPVGALPVAHAICNSEKGNDTKRTYFERRNAGDSPRAVLSSATATTKPRSAGMPFTYSWLLFHGYIEEH